MEHTPSVYRRCFRVRKGPILDALLALAKQREVIQSQWTDLKTELGASDLFQLRGQFYGARFSDGPPNDRLWKLHPRERRMYFPRRNTPEGRELLKRIEAMPKLPLDEDVLEQMGLHDGVVLMDGRRGYCPTIVGSVKLKTWFVTVPWMDMDPKKIKAYLKDNAKGRCFDANLSHLGLWKPSENLQEIKEWEMHRDIERLNAKIKAMQDKPAKKSTRRPAQKTAKAA